jgi:hypothetical protein
MQRNGEDTAQGQPSCLDDPLGVMCARSSLPIDSGTMPRS